MDHPNKQRDVLYHIPKKLKPNQGREFYCGEVYINVHSAAMGRRRLNPSDRKSKYELYVAFPEDPQAICPTCNLLFMEDPSQSTHVKSWSSMMAKRRFV